MSVVVPRVALMGVVLCLSAPASADEPPAAEPLPAPPVDPDTLPAPRQLLPSHPPLPAESYYPAYQRINRWAVWDNYAVDRQGYFKPRVIYSPYGSYYRYNGAPYPWIGIHERDFQPTFSNAAVFPPPVMRYAED